MNKKEIFASFEALGWCVETDDVGDKVAFFYLKDRIVDLIPDIRIIRNEQQLSTLPTLSTSSFCEVCQNITGRERKYTPLVRAWNGNRICALEILQQHVFQASEKAIAWALEQDLDKALKEHALLPTDAPGARPIWHLAALALLGDVEKLKFYEASFEAGDRLGFVPYVTKDYIDRAVAFAEKKALEER